MWTIERSSAFKKDYKRAAKGQYRKILDKILITTLTRLVTDERLPSNYRDHDLSGSWAGYRECHLKPDLLLIYEKPGNNTLKLARLGSHSNLFE